MSVQKTASNLVPRNLGAIRSGNYTPQQLHDCLADLLGGIKNIAEQGNLTPVGETPAPQPHSAISVKGGAGVADVKMDDESEQYRGNENFFDYSFDGWKTFQTKHVGAPNNWRGYLGKGMLHVRSYTSYATTSPSDALYHDAVDTTGSDEPEFQASAGSGTGTAGYGDVPYNAVTPPKRA